MSKNGAMRSWPFRARWTIHWAGHRSIWPTPASHRRTLYACISRHNLDPLLRLFDFPDPNITSDGRPVTMVPLQQLFVLNSDLMATSAKALAARCCAAKPNDADRIRQAIEITLGRPATENEIEIGLEFFRESPAPSSDNVGLTRWEQYAQILLSTNEFMFVD